MKKIKILIQILFLIFPWKIRRYVLNMLPGFKIHKTARIRLSLVLAERLEMGENSRISNFSICNGIDSLIMCDYAKIGTFIYITGYPSSLKAHFSHIKNRKCELIIGNHSAITSRHFIDCTAGIKVGSYTTLAGIRSQMLTHSIDLVNNRQDAKPIKIGNYCFIGTNCVMLPGSELPDFSILGAKSLLNKALEEEDYLYGGVPVSKIIKLNRSEVAYFNRIAGSVK